MAKNKIEVNRDEFFDGNEENDIINKILKYDFLLWFKKNGFDEKYLRKIFQEKRLSSSEQNNFNSNLRKAKQELGINIYEIILYLENNIYKLKKILSILDEETMYILKKELSSKYKIKLDLNVLYKILK